MYKVKHLQKNQVVVFKDETTDFWSYESLIFSYNGTKEEIIFYKDWDYSKTTLKWLKVALKTYTPIFEVSKKEIEDSFKTLKLRNIKVSYIGE